MYVFITIDHLRRTLMITSQQPITSWLKDDYDANMNCKQQVQRFLLIAVKKIKNQTKREILLH